MPENHPAIATSYNNVGYAYGELGEHKKELDYYLKALAIQEKVLPENHPDIATSYNNVGGAYGELGEYKKALEYYQRLLSIQNDTLL